MPGPPSGFPFLYTFNRWIVGEVHEKDDVFHGTVLFEVVFEKSSGEEESAEPDSELDGAAPPLTTQSCSPSLTAK